FRGGAVLLARYAPGPANLPRGTADLELRSKRADAVFTIGPSVVVQRLRAVGTEITCPDVTDSTVFDKDIEVAVRAAGMGQYSASNPWTLELSFDSPHVRARYRINPQRLPRLILDRIDQKLGIDNGFGAPDPSIEADAADNARNSVTLVASSCAR